MDDDEIAIVQTVETRPPIESDGGDNSQELGSLRTACDSARESYIGTQSVRQTLTGAGIIVLTYILALATILFLALP